MGNNHNKYFGTNKRKVLILGLACSGKTTLLRILKDSKKGTQRSLQYVPTELFNNEAVIIPSQKGKNGSKAGASALELDLWDLGGKLPHLWVHHFTGAQGVIFVIDDLSVACGDATKVQQIVKELINVIHGNANAPIAIIVNRKTNLAAAFEEDEDSGYRPILDWNAWIKTHILEKISDAKRYGVKVFDTDLMKEKGLSQVNFATGESTMITDCLAWMSDKMQAV
ncbi:hypothetical protein FGO68_gene1175 [Halteria grandinella]|uniref:Uncharacterized protein n=1 Tax=Halteria grandinella TaxID=5974 RepID=A0A8J8SYY5_HALGN|nr:hypothetical protein FGO68_gene1175 [Halteria grandinella]